MQGLDGYWANLGGKRFEDRTEKLFPRSPWGAMGVAVFDFDNDADLDLFVTDMHSDMSATPPWTEEKRKPEQPYDLTSRRFALLEAAG